MRVAEVVLQNISKIFKNMEKNFWGGNKEQIFELLCNVHRTMFIPASFLTNEEET